MKYCTNCGAKMEDEALFCSKCGTKAAPIIEEKKESYEEDQVVEETPKKPNKAVKGPAKPLHEEKLKEFLPVSLVVIAATILLWIIQNLVHPTDILRVMPLIISFVAAVTHTPVMTSAENRSYAADSAFLMRTIPTSSPDETPLAERFWRTSLT